MVLPYINMNPPRVYMCSPSWTPPPPPSPSHPSGSFQCTSPEHPVSCIEPGLEIHFTYDIIHVSMPFSQIIPSLPCPTESKRLFYTSVSLLLSHIQSYHYHLSKFHIYMLVYYIGVSFWLTSQWPGGPTPCPRSHGCTGAGGPRGAIPRWGSGGAAVRRYPSSKVRETQVRR